MSFESKMKKHIQKVFDENVPNLYEKVEVKKTFSLKKMLMPLSVTALACAAIVAVIIPLSSTSSLRNNDSKFENHGDASPSESSNNEGAGTQSGDKPYINERMSLVAAPKATTLSSIDSSFVNRTAQKSLQSLDNLFKNKNNGNYIVSPASYLLGAAGLCAVSDGIDASNYGLTDSLNETKMLLESWNCFSKITNPDTGVEEIISKIDSGILHQQIGARYEFNDGKRNSVEDEYIATSITSVSNYRSQAQEYFQDIVKLDMSVPNLGLTDDSVVSYSMLKFSDNANLGPTENRYFTSGTDTVMVKACVYGDSAEHAYHTDVYETANYIAFKRQVRNSDILFIVPKGNASLEDITVSEAYTEFMNNKVDRLAYGYIPYFHTRNAALDVSGAIKNSFTGTEKLYSKLLEDYVNGSSIELKMIQNADYSFEDDDAFNASASDYNPGENGGSEAMRLDVDRPFYAICLKDNFPLFVNKVTDLRNK